MKTIQINTTQNVSISFETADIGRRILAFSIDNVLKIAYLYIVFKVLDIDVFEQSFDDVWSKQAYGIILTLPVMLYSIVFEILLNGQTLGKRLMKIRVVNIDGFKPSIPDFLMRWFLRVVDFNFWMLLFIYASSLGVLNNLMAVIILFFLFGKTVGIISILVTKSNQRIGDMAANTIVISLQDDAKFSNTILENISEIYHPTFQNVISLSDNDIRIIKKHYLSAVKSHDYRSLTKLRNKIVSVIGVEGENMHDKDFIDTILKDYNYYTQNM